MNQNNQAPTQVAARISVGDIFVTALITSVTAAFVSVAFDKVSNLTGSYEKRAERAELNARRHKRAAADAEDYAQQMRKKADDEAAKKAEKEAAAALREEENKKDTEAA